jgi:hypothetical protein
MQMVHQNQDYLGCVPRDGVGAVGKWPAGATFESLAPVGHLSTAAATVVDPGRIGLRLATLTQGHHDDRRQDYPSKPSGEEL